MHRGLITALRISIGEHYFRPAAVKQHLAQCRRVRPFRRRSANPGGCRKLLAMPRLHFESYFASDALEKHRHPYLTSMASFTVPRPGLPHVTIIAAMAMERYSVLAREAKRRCSTALRAAFLMGRNPEGL
jgi:hypothetical protein